jgi:galactose mutarotase-like enzyme
MIDIASRQLSATVNPFGAELMSLRDGQGRELMTDADPAFWAGHAPILFPIVGRLNGDVLRIDGVEYPMKQHGFARRMAWEVVGAGVDAVTLLLRDDASTRASYPFAFDLAVLYLVEEATLSCRVRVSNTGDVPLPMSFGFHPAFAWPLPYGAPREDHRIVFAADEPAPIKRLSDGLIAGDRPSPLDDRTLALTDALFADDALVWDPIHSSGVSYGPPSGPRLDIDFPDTPQLGIWSKPGAAFVCIEPWHGHADPAGFTGDFRNKPGVIQIAPGDEWRCSMDVTLRA